MKFGRFLIATVVGAALAVPAAAQQTYSFGTNPQGSLFYGVATAISKLMNEKAGLLMRVQVAGGTSTIAPQMDAGKVDFSLNNALEARFTYSGTGTFEGKPMPNVRVVTMVYPLKVSFAVPADSPIKRITDAKGKRIPSEFTSQNIMQEVQDALLANAGLKQADFAGVPVTDYIKGGDLMTQGKVDLSMVAPGTGASKKQHADLRSQGGLRFVSIDESPEALKRMRTVFPETFPIKINPDAATSGVVGPTVVMAYPFFVVAGKHVSDEVVHKMVTAMHANAKALGDTYGPLKAFDPKDMWRKHATPYHPGALKAFRDLGLTMLGS